MASKVSGGDTLRFESGNEQADAAYFDQLVINSKNAFSQDTEYKPDPLPVNGSGDVGVGKDIEIRNVKIADKTEDTENVNPPEDFGDNILDIKIEGDTTVSQKASEEFINGIKNDVKNGKIKEDSKEAQLAQLFEASAALNEGYSLYGYAEVIESGGSTYRESDTDPTKLTGKDVKEILDEGKVSEKIAEYMQDETISGRYESALKDAVGKIPESKRNEMKDKVNAALFNNGEPNTDFEKGIIGLYEKGDDASKDKAEKLTDDYFQALQQLDPDAYPERRQTFNSLLSTHQIDKAMVNPESLDPEAVKTGLADTFTMVKSGVNAALKGLKEGDKAYDSLKKLGDDVSSFQNIYKDVKSEDIPKVMDAIIDASEKGGSSADLDKIVEDKLKGLSTKREETASGLKKVLYSAASTGTLGSITGVMSLASGVYSIAKGGWGQMTSDERIAAARDLVGGLSGVKDFTTFGSNIIEKLGGTQQIDGKDVPKVKATDWLGIWDQNFPDIWKADAPKDALSKAISSSIAETSEAMKDKPVTAGLTDADSNTLNNQISEDVGRAMGAPDPKSGGSKGGFDAGKAGRSFLRFVSGAGLDVTGGALDIVSGVRKLQKAETPLEKAAAGTTLGSGIASTGAGIATTISMFAGKGASIASKIVAPLATKIVQGLTVGARVAGPVLGVAGAVLGVVGSLIAEAVEHNKMQKLTDSQGKFFADLAKQGVAQGDWGDKLEFARYSTYMYGGRDTPDDKSIFAFQANEWKHFQETEGKKGSSLNRLAPGLHRDSDLNTKNLWETHLTGSTTSSGPHGHVRKNDDWRPWGDTDQEKGGLDSTTAYYTRSVGQTYGKDFLEENRTHIETIVDTWDDWNGKDSIVSEKDLRKIADDNGRSEDERSAAKFLLDNEKFRRALDGIRENGSQDTKISSKDLNAWFREIDGGLSV